MGKKYVWSVATSKGTRFSSLSFQVSTSTKADWTRSTTWRVFILCTLTGVALRLCFTSPPYCPTRKTILKRYTHPPVSSFIITTIKIIIITRKFLFFRLWKSVAKKTARRQRYRLRRFSRIQHDRLLTGLHQIPFSSHVHSRSGVAEIAQETHPIRSKNRDSFSPSRW